MRGICPHGFEQEDGFAFMTHKRKKRGRGGGEIGENRHSKVEFRRFVL